MGRSVALPPARDFLPLRRKEGTPLLLVCQQRTGSRGPWCPMGLSPRPLCRRPQLWAGQWRPPPLFPVRKVHGCCWCGSVGTGSRASLVPSRAPPSILSAGVLNYGQVSGVLLLLFPVRKVHGCCWCGSVGLAAGVPGALTAPSPSIPLPASSTMGRSEPPPSPPRKGGTPLLLACLRCARVPQQAPSPRPL